MSKRDEVVKGVEHMSAAHSLATQRVVAHLPDEIDMQTLIGIVGNICLQFGVTKGNLTVFTRGLSEFVEIMDDSLKRRRH